MNNADIFSLQYTMKQAEAVRGFINGRRPEQLAPSLDAVLRAAIQLGEQLPDALRRTMRGLSPADGEWMTVQQYEEERNAVRSLFSAVRETMDDARRAAEAWQARLGREAADLPRLHALMEDACRLEEEVFRDWPSFADPLPPPDLTKALTPEESLAAALGVSVEQAHARMEARRRELDSQRRG